MTDTTLRAVAPPEVDPDAERLKEIKRQRDELRERRFARNEEQSKREALETAERGLRDEQAIERAEAEHGAVGKKIAVIETDMGAIIVKRANHVIFRKFQENGRDENGVNFDEAEKLVKHALVYPTRAEFDRIAEDLPATIMRCADAVAILAGIRVKERVAK
jgi:hypothetical protein